ncbi:MAG: peptidoglycan DD-metalloendopeptidase family protein [bacterium]|nr:peptidoglycan DD-metalloendopeptidase family protein [bacterium]
MKQSKDYKKLFLSRDIVFLAILLLAFFSLLIFLQVSYAQTTDQSIQAGEVKAKIDQRNADILKLEAEIRLYQGELNNLGKQKSTLSSSIQQLDLTRKKLVTDITLAVKKIDKTNNEIENLSKDIGSKEELIDNNHSALIIDIQNIYELEQTSLTETLLKTDNLASVWNDIDNMATVREAIMTKIQNLKLAKGELEGAREETFKAKNELLSLKSKLADDKKIIEQNTNQKNKLLKQTKNNESNYQKLLKDRQALKVALEKELRDYESQLKFILDPSTLPSGGVLSWPLDDIYVTQLFGKTQDSKRLYASGSHSGVDFRASVGTPVKAMADGVVKGIGDTDTTCPGASFGKWVFIQYNNGLSSTFGHLSLTKAYDGQKVERGQIVGSSGATGHVTGPHLHVTVYASGAAGVKTVPSKSCAGKTLTQPLAATNAYLDPMFYLPPYKK